MGVNRVPAMEMRVLRNIARPSNEVFDFLADASNNPLWQGGMQSCRWTSPLPIGVGSTYEQQARFLGRAITSTFVVTEFEPGRRIALRTLESTFPIEVERQVEQSGSGTCRVSAIIRGGPNGRLAALLAPVANRLAQRSIDRDYDRLVEYLE